MAFSENLGTDVDFNSSISIRFDSGAQASIGIVGNSPCLEENITIWGSKGVMFYRNGRIEYLLFDGESRIEPLKMGQASNPDKGFIEAVLGKEDK